MLPTGLSMLWEDVEPEQALRERFGFAGLAAVDDWLSVTMHEQWRLEVGPCRRLVISDRNAIGWVDSDRGPLVVKWSCASERFERLDASTRLLRALDDHGVPLAAPVVADDGRVRVVVDGPLGPLSVAVLPELAGDWLDITDPAAVAAAGACLATLHEALRHQADDRPGPEDGVRDLHAQIETWLATADPGLDPAASARLRGLVADLPTLDDEPQLVHNDFRAANLLTRSSTVVGVLDFDELAWAHRVEDLAKASVYLGTVFTDWRPTPVAVQQRFRAGYESVRPLRPLEARWFEALLLWQETAARPQWP